MALSDMAEAWWREPHMPYMGRDFIHIEGRNCSHINQSSGNTDTSKYHNDINCFECLKELLDFNLIKGTSARQQSAIDKEKHRHRFGTCSCGCPQQIRVQRNTKKEFLGCINYPTCKITKSMSKASDNVCW